VIIYLAILKFKPMREQHGRERICASPAEGDRAVSRAWNTATLMGLVHQGHAQVLLAMKKLLVLQ